jgi:hypothetical protein
LEASLFGRPDIADAGEFVAIEKPGQNIELPRWAARLRRRQNVSSAIRSFEFERRSSTFGHFALLPRAFRQSYASQLPHVAQI